MLNVQPSKEDDGVDNELPQISVGDALVDDDRQYLGRLVELHVVRPRAASIARIAASDVDVHGDDVAISADELNDASVQPLRHVHEEQQRGDQTAVEDGDRSHLKKQTHLNSERQTANDVILRKIRSVVASYRTKEKGR